MTVAIIVPVLWRPHRVGPLMDSVATATDDYRLLFVASTDDDAERCALEDAGADFVLSDAPPHGQYARKINHGVHVTDEPFLLFAADDLRFRKGWFDRAVARMTATVGVVGTNDLGNRHVLAGRHATHPLVARWYAGQETVDGSPGPLHEGYDHNFVDNEFVQVAQTRGAWDFAKDSVVEHLHPSWEKAEWDATYERGRSKWYRDQRLFRQRARLWSQVPA